MVADAPSAQRPPAPATVDVEAVDAPAAVDKSAGLTPRSAALASASVKKAAKPGHVSVGSLRIRVLRAIDLPPPQAAEGSAPTSSSTSWLRYSGMRQSQHQQQELRATSGMICVLLQAAASATLATETQPWASAIRWDEEFYIDQVASDEELTLSCVDRARNDSYSVLPPHADVNASPGFIGKVCVPLIRLPEGEVVEQWYPLASSNGSSRALRTALRVSLCFVPNGTAIVRAPSSSSRQRVTPTSVLPVSPESEVSLASPVTKKPLEITIPDYSSGKDSEPVIPLEAGIIDYVIVVGAAPTGGEQQTPSLHESHVRFRFPQSDRPGFPLPTKIEWFCFPDGPEVVVQAKRPRSKLFSFVLVGGDDGLCCCYAVCLTVYHREGSQAKKSSSTTVWHPTCVAFLTRLPVIDKVTTCLLAVARAWLRVTADQMAGEEVSMTKVRDHIVKLCHGVALPVRGVFGVQFALDKLKLRFVLPSNTSIYSPSRNSGQLVPSRGSTKSRGAQTSPLKSPSRNFITTQQGFKPLVYSLEPIFQLFDLKTIIHLVALVLCEYRILVHSSHQSLLCPVTEGLCTLIYPFRWQHPYVPILPRVLSEYLQAPLPYILGIHSSWLHGMLENGRPEHLVVVDVDRGTIQQQEAGGPMLPHTLTKGLHRRLKAILHPSLYEEDGQELEGKRRELVEWGDGVEKQVRTEFVCYLASVVRGYRECLFFVNQRLPVFNKRRFFESEATDSEVVPFVSRLLSTQAFQTFLESHSSAEMSVFHSVYLTLGCGAKELQWPSSMPLSLSTLSIQGSTQESNSTAINTPVLILVGDEYGNQEAPVLDESESRKECDQPSTTAPVAATSGVSTGSDEEEATAANLGEHVEILLDELDRHHTTPFALDADDVEIFSSSGSGCQPPSTVLNHQQLAQRVGVDPNVLQANAQLLLNAHAVNQYRFLQDGTESALFGSTGSGGSGRFLSSEDERIEQVLHKCLTAVFTSDDSLAQDETKTCEQNFKSAHARELFVLILMQPNNQYVESKNTGSPSAAGGTRRSSTWYNPKGSGNCLGAAGFKLLARLASALMNQCAIHEDFTNARGILQIASQYYHYVEDKHSGIGFAKKEYLVTPLRLLPICRSLDLWQHAFICEIDAAIQADPVASSEDEDEDANNVGDELFFSVTGSLMYDMLSFEVPLAKVQTFVTVMCATYHKGRDLLSTLKQLAENVYRALDMSRDIKPSPPKGAEHPRLPSCSSNAGMNSSSTTTSSSVLGASKSSTSVAAKNPVVNGSAASSTMAFGESPVASREYDLDTVIRRKMSIEDRQQQHKKKKHTSRSPAGSASNAAGTYKSVHTSQEDDAMDDEVSCHTPPMRRRRSSLNFPNVVLSSSDSPVLSLATFGGRAVCGLASALVNVVDAEPVDDNDKGVRLEGHTDAVVSLQIRGNTLISGSRDHTLRAWDVRATPKKRHLFSFFSLTHQPSSGAVGGAGEVDGASVSKRSLVLRGHSAAVTCVELGRQLGSARALVASGSDDGTARLWETTCESSVALLSSNKEDASKTIDHGGVSCLRFLSRDDDLALGCRNRSLQIWDLAATRMKVNVHAHHAGVRDLQISGSRLVTAGNDRVVKIWDASFRSDGSDSQQCVQALRDHGGPVQSVSLGGPADPNICTGAADGLVRVWDLRYAQRGPRLTLRGHEGPVTRLQRDFTKLVSAGEDGWLRVWDMQSGVCLREKLVHRSGVSCLELRDSLVYSGSWDGTLRVWDIENVGSPMRGAA